MTRYTFGTIVFEAEDKPRLLRGCHDKRRNLAAL